MFTVTLMRFEMTTCDLEITDRVAAVLANTPRSKKHTSILIVVLSKLPSPYSFCVNATTKTDGTKDRWSFSSFKTTKSDRLTTSIIRVEVNSSGISRNISFKNVNMFALIHHRSN